jgi:uncharacterized protein (UPF0333 family)
MSYLKYIQKINSFRKAKKAVAMVEFALVLPVMLIFLLGMVETVNFFKTKRTVDTATMNQIYNAMKAQMNMSMGSSLGSVLSSTDNSLNLYVANVKRTDTTFTVLWSCRGDSGSTCSTTSTTNTPSGLLESIDRNIVPDGDSFVVSWIKYNYSPKITSDLFNMGAITGIERGEIYPVRDATSISWCTNGVNTTKDGCL